MLLKLLKCLYTISLSILVQRKIKNSTSTFWPFLLNKQLKPHALSKSKLFLIDFLIFLFVIRFLILIIYCLSFNDIKISLYTKKIIKCTFCTICPHCAPLQKIEKKIFSLNWMKNSKNKILNLLSSKQN